MSKIIVLTHVDLDALGCVMCIKQKFNIEKFFYTNYYDLSKVKNEILEYSNQNIIDTLLIADVSFSDNIAILEELSDNFKNVILIDHHLTDFSKIRIENLKIVHDVNRCGAKLCFDTFKIKNQGLEKLINYINAYDIWQRKSELFDDAFYLNEMFFSLKKNDNSNIEKIANLLYNKEDKVFKMLPAFKEKCIKKFDEQVEDLKKRKLIFKSSDIKTTVVLTFDCFNYILKNEIESGQDFVIGVHYGIIKVRINEFSDISEKFKLNLRGYLLGKENFGHLNAFTYATKYKTNDEVINEIQKICDFIKEHKNDNC